jgi:hypothetical protein
VAHAFHLSFYLSSAVTCIYIVWKKITEFCDMSVHVILTHLLLPFIVR